MLMNEPHSNSIVSAPPCPRCGKELIVSVVRAAKTVSAMCDDRKCAWWGWINAQGQQAERVTA